MFEDQEIINNHKKWENETKSDIYSNVYINGEVFTYGNTLLLANKMEMMLPNEFKDMPRKMVEMKYPMSDRPKIIKTNMLGSVNYTFNELPVPCKETDIEKNVKTLKLMLTRVFPQYKMLDEYQGKTVNTLYYGFDYVFHAIDISLYNLMYGFCIDGLFIQGCFNCPEEEKDLWIPSVLQSIESIKDLTKREEKR